jgi:hypothetical protein
MEGPDGDWCRSGCGEGMAIFVCYFAPGTLIAALLYDDV